MNIQNIGSMLGRVLTRGIGVEAKTPSVNTLQLSNVLGGVRNASVASPVASAARGGGGNSPGVVAHLAGVRGNNPNPASLNIPPMAQRVAMACYHQASLASGTNLGPSTSSHSVVSRGGEASENTTQTKNECRKDLPPIALQLMAEIAKHEESKVNTGPLKDKNNLPPIAQQLLVELAKHEDGKANRGPISPDSQMGKELQAMVSDFDKFRSGTL
ncbi:hypothetical protein [Providencia alcalifaciens]